jgi:hypothetical protein
MNSDALLIPVAQKCGKYHSECGYENTTSASDTIYYYYLIKD